MAKTHSFAVTGPVSTLCVWWSWLLPLLKRLGRGHMQPSRAADPLTFRGAVDALQKRGVKPHIDGRFSCLLFGNRRGRDRGALLRK